MKISFIMPGRNNLKYAKWSYDSIQKNKGLHDVQICFADDASTDGTWEWCNEMMQKDENFNAIRNDTGSRLGHTILYDKLINEVAKYDICIIWHCDMYLCPDSLDAIEHHINPTVIVSLTRIEPPLHPDGVEKLLVPWGATEPEQFDEDKFLLWYNGNGDMSYHPQRHRMVRDKMGSELTTEGIFAPWAFYKESFISIGGHDYLYAPQSKEDSDIFNRFKLNGIKFIQTWDGFVYHMTCRGSRYNPTITTVGTESAEWLNQNFKSTLNFIRKWGHFVSHDSYLNPTIHPKYDIGFILSSVTNPASQNMLDALEPWCNVIYVPESDLDSVKKYIVDKQPTTDFDLSDRVKVISEYIEHGIIVNIDSTTFNDNDFNVITHLGEIIKDSGEIGEFVIGNLSIQITDMTEYQNSLIVNTRTYDKY